MPWKEATVVSEREELVRKFESGHYSVTELAEQFGVSHPTVYLWLRLYEAEGLGALVSRRPVPKSCPHKTSPAAPRRRDR